MKKLLVLAVALASVNAFATRARMTALANSPHLIDTQTVYSNPADMFYVGGDYVTAESGIGTANGRTSANSAEGMVVRSWGDAKAGLAIGHMSPLSVTLRSNAAASFPGNTALLQQNPIELSYGMKAGDLAWAGTLTYSKAENKIAPNEKEDSLGLKGGFRMGAMDAYVGLGLANNYSNDTSGKFTGTMGIQAAFGYWLDTTYLNAKVTTAGNKVETAAGVETSKFATMQYGISATNSMKKDGSEFFYGAGLTSTENKTTVPGGLTDSTTTSLALPITLGLEADANSWLVFRASVTQALPLLNTSKTSAGNPSVTTAERAAVVNNTTFAAGAGIKFSKLTLDGSLMNNADAAANQAIGTANLLGQVGLTYMF